MRKIINIFLIFFIKLQSIQSRDVDCDFDSEIEFGLTCALKGIYDQNFTITNVTPELSQEVRSVSFASSHVTEFPAKIFKIFPKLKHITVENAGIRKLEQNSFEGGEHIVRMDLDRNSIERLESQVFLKLRKLDVLELSTNQINYVDQEAFYQLPDLAVLSLSYNQIKEILVDTFKDNPRLSLLYLHYNQLEFLPAEIFKHNPALKQIYIHNNKINALSSETFAHLRRAHIINLSQNVCTNELAVSFGVFKKCDDNYRKLAGIPDSSFKDDDEDHAKKSANPYLPSWDSFEDAMYIDYPDDSHLEAANSRVVNKTARKVRMEIEEINDDFHDSANAKIFFLITFNVIVAVICGFAVYKIKKMKTDSTSWTVLNI